MYPKQPYPVISVLICALNEEANLPSVLRGIPAWVDEIILIDGHSTDNTVKVSKETLPAIKVLIQPTKGKGEALKFGVVKSKGDIIITLDADGTYPPEEMPQFIDAILQGYDFAKGTRFFKRTPDSMTTNRKVGNKVLTLASNLLFNTQYTDLCSGYYAFKPKVFSKIRLRSNGFELEQELFVKLKKYSISVKEIPHSYRTRRFGYSKTNDFRQGLKNLLLLVAIRFSLN